MAMNRWSLAIFPLLWIQVVTEHERVLIPNYELEWRPVLADEPGCEMGWLEYGPFCLYVISEPQTWKGAANLCEKYGSHLLPGLKGVTELQTLAVEVIEATNLTEFWAGVHLTVDDNSVMSAFWTDGKVAYASEAYWSPRQPDISYGHCVKIERSPGSHLTTTSFESCDKHLPSICLRDRVFSNGTVLCKDGKPIPKHWLCDDMPDCADHTDEIYCRTPCKEDFEGTFGDISHMDTSYNDIYCYWTIHAPHGTIIKMQLETVDTEPGLDIISIYGGGITEWTSKLVAKISGDQAPDDPLYSPNNMAVVTFVTDSSTVGRGFLLHWEAVPVSSICGDDIVVNDTYGTLESPFYPHSTILPDCEWQLTSVDGNVFTVMLVDVDLPEECHLIMYDSRNPRVPVLRVQHAKQPIVHLSQSDTMILRLYGCSGLLVSGRGFRIKYITGCRIDLDADHGDIQTPNFGLGTYPNVDCIWMLNATSGKPLSLLIHHLWLEANKDFLKVFAIHDNGTEVELHPGNGFTGVMFLYESLSAHTSVLRLELDTDAAIGRSGLLAAFSVDCPDLLMTSGTHLVSGTFGNRLGSRFSIECDLGYMFVSEEYYSLTQVNVECLPNSHWNIRTSPFCQPRYCGPPPRLSNGHVVSATGVRYMDYTQYGCDSAFRMRGSDRIYCKDDGHWEEPSGCAGQTCNSLTQRDYLRTTVVHGDGLRRGSIIEFDCDDGYVLEGSSITMCDDNGWSENSPICIPKLCVVPVVDHGSLSPSGATTQFGASVQVLCNPGYRRAGASQITCQADLTYTEEPTCQDINECREGSDNCEQNCMNTDGSFLCFCNEGYQIHPILSSLCVDVLECQQNNGGCDQTCIELPGSYRCACVYGYTLFIQDGIMGFLLPAGSAGSLPSDPLRIGHSCVPNQCPILAMNFRNGMWLPLQDKFNYGDVVTYICDIGYLVRGPNRIVCQGDGTWDEPPPICREAVCNDMSHLLPALVGPPPGVYRPYIPSPVTAVAYGSYLTGTCIDGAPSSIVKYLCTYDQASGMYKFVGGSVTCPVIDCGTPPVIPGSIAVTTSSTIYGATYTFQCDSSHRLEGSGPQGGTTVECGEFGAWDLGSLICRSKTCMDPGTPPGTVQSAQTYEVGALVTFTCLQSGFTLTDPNPLLCEARGLQNEWNATLPSCIDTESPVIVCPTDPVTLAMYVTLVDHGFTMPVITDNTGGYATLTMTPTNFRTTQPITEDIIVTFTVFDYAGLSDSCTVQIIVLDQEPPILTCPQNIIITLEAPSYARTFTPSLENPATATDNSGTLSTTYDPQVMVFTANSMNTRPVLVTSVDPSGNSANCTFMVIPEGASCDPISLKPGIGVNSNCIQVVNGYLCTATCQSDLYFRQQSQIIEYTCTTGGTWNPPTPVQCAPSIANATYTIQFMMISSVLTAVGSGKTVQGCIDGITNYVYSCTSCRQEAGARLVTWFSSVTNVNDVNFVLGANRLSLEMLEVNVTLTLLPDGLLGTDYSTSRNFLETAGGFAVESFNTNQLTGCADVSWKFNSQWVHEAFVCPQGSMLIPQTAGAPFPCVPCPAGTQYNSAQDSCSLCAHGTYQPGAGQTSCLSCPTGTSTRSEGSTALEDCIAKCQAGWISTLGIPPCQPCPKGSYSVSHTQCMSCPLAQTTPLAGAGSQSQCTDECTPGSYSALGTSPCSLCPVGFYSESTGRTLCNSCPSQQITAARGSSSQADCTSTVSCASCVNDVTCTIQFNHMICICQPGYTGSACEVNIDECASSPCYNGGTCDDLVNGFQCNCPPGYAGNMCQIDPNNCASQNCINGGVCQDLSDSFRCLCPSNTDLSGPRCNITPDVCLNQPCQNFATCIQQTDTRRICVCLPGYEGTDCSVFTDDCASTPCFHGGSCIDGVASYTCVCPRGFSGSQCEIRQDPCVSVQCMGTCLDNYTAGVTECICPLGYEAQGNRQCQAINHCMPDPCVNGFCSRTSPGYTCTCDPGYTGVTCGHNIDECESSPCEYGGTCQDLVNQFRCTCLAGYTGPRCRVDIDDCTPSQCVNGGACTDRINDYHCHCTPGYTGKNCETDINECILLRPCRNGASCVNMMGSYQCQCVPGWQGRDCLFTSPMCDGSPCENSAQCYNLLLDFFCSCTAGTTGKTCSNQASLCESINPCLNNGTCQGTNIDYVCQCTGDYTGQGCEVQRDLCSQNPCLNGGTCHADLDMFTCRCIPGYSGILCEVDTDECTSNPCPPLAECVDQINKYSCRCLPGSVGPNCTKAANNDFDLTFYLASSHAEVTSPIPVTGATSLGLSIWIRPYRPGRVLSIYAFCNCPKPDPRKIITIDVGDRLKVILVMPSGNDVTEFSVSRLPYWIHLAMSLDLVSGTLDIYHDGSRKIKELGARYFEDFTNLFHVSLGQSEDGKSGSFVGDISQFFMWNRALSYVEDVEPVNSFVRSLCTRVNRTGLLIDWANVERGPGIHRKTPARCKDEISLDVPVQVLSNTGMKLSATGGSSIGYWTTVNRAGISANNLNLTMGVTIDTCKELCEDMEICRSFDYGWSDRRAEFECLRSNVTKDQVPEYFRKYNNHSYHELTRYIEKKRPAVIYCRDDLYIHARDRAVNVTWKPPRFRDYDTITSNYESGSLFTWGEYVVTYVASSLEGAVATCHFRLFVYYWDCQESLSRIERVGSAVCYQEGGFPSCSPSCGDMMLPSCGVQAFMRTCTPWGTFDALYLDDGDQDRCSEFTPKKCNLTVVIRYPLVAQTRTIERLLSTYTMAGYKNIPGVCLDQVNCDNVELLHPECEPTQGCVLTAHITLAEILVWQSNSMVPVLDLIRNQLDRPEGLLFDFTDDPISVVKGIPSSYSIEEFQYCEPGSVYYGYRNPQTGQMLCVKCCVGSYHNVDTCDPCPVGSYQETPGQQSCVRCPSMMTTTTPGASNSSQCQSECPVGHYFDTFLEYCKPCPLGFYQDEQGLIYCKTCRVHQSTAEEGAVNQSMCYDLCDAGYGLEIDGLCRPCDIGHYRPASMHPHCYPCKNNHITRDVASTSEQDCSIPACSPGEFLHEGLNGCLPCPWDTYQPDKWQTSCVPCGRRYRTETKGATEQSQCRFFCESGWHEFPRGECTICPRSYFKDNDDDIYGGCEPCPDGFTTKTPGATSLLNCTIAACDPGEYLKEEENECESCPHDTYQPLPLQTECERCPRSTRTDITGATQERECIFFCPAGQEEAPRGACRPCQRGYYKNNDENPHGFCRICPPMFITAREGAVSRRDCNIANCSAGTYISGRECRPCPMGTYQPERWQTTCHGCPDQYTTVYEGSVDPDQCLFFCESGMAVHPIDNETCEACPRGFYKNNREDQFGVCKLCPMGTTTPYDMATSLQDCKQMSCQPGTYRNASINWCFPCPRGTYQPARWHEECIPCGRNHTTLDDGATEANECRFYCPSGYEESPPGSRGCQGCLRGMYRNSREDPLGPCKACDNGWTTPGTLSTSESWCNQIACPTGTYRNTSMNDCRLCPVGKYQPRRWQDRCLTCQYGHSTRGLGSRYSNECIRICPAGHEPNGPHCDACSYGYFKEYVGVHPCQRCLGSMLTLTRGSTWPGDCEYEECRPGLEYHLDSDHCQECPIAQYRDGDGGPVCVNCPNNTITEQPGASSVEMCNLPWCRAGSYLHKESRRCRHCPKGSYQPDKWQKRCLDCPHDHSTLGEGADSREHCYSTNECLLKTHNCSSKAHCVNTKEAFRCLCFDHYNGDGSNCTHVCDLGYCENEGTCLREKWSEQPYCICKDLYMGIQCRIRNSGLLGQSTVIIGAVVGVVLFVLLLIFVIVGVFGTSRMRRRKDKKGPIPPVIPPIVSTYPNPIFGSRVPGSFGFIPPTHLTGASQVGPVASRTPALTYFDDTHENDGVSLPGYIKKPGLFSVLPPGTAGVGDILPLEEEAGAPKTSNMREIEVTWAPNVTAIPVSSGAENSAGGMPMSSR